jgi:hypothetical protein
MNTDIYVKYITYVLRCAVLGEKCGDIPKDINQEFLLRLCRFHKIENIVYLMLRDKLEPDIKAIFEQLYERAVYLQAMQDYYLELVENAFENEGIDYLLLKGKEISSLYPSEDMRQSSDFDIYIGRENAARAKDIMLREGFKIEAYSDANDDHDEYTADKIILCELHRVLIQNKQPWQEECNKIPERLLLCEGTTHRMKMRSEDFYIYNLAHTAKHMKFSGIGIRAFLDMWIIYNRFSDSFDTDYLNEKLRLCHLTEFDKSTKKLCAYWFEDGEADEITVAMSDYVVQSGWVGTYEQAKSTELAENAGVTNSVKAAKLKKYYDIIAVPYESMVYRYPILKKYRFLTPFCRIHRIMRALFKRRDLIKEVSAEMENGDMEKGKAILSLKKSIGL